MKKIYYLISFLLILLLNANGQNKKFTLAWSDEFNYSGLPDSTKWSYDVGGHGWGNNELQFYTKNRLENTKVENGILSITARKENYKGCNYTSARLVTAGKGDFLYGRIEIRAKLPKGRGTWPAIWMLSSDWAYGAWPESGEIDIMEHVGYNPNQIHFSIHCLDYFFKINTQKSNITKLFRTDSLFYTYALEWTPENISGYIGDSLYFSFDNEHKGWTKWPFDKPFHLLLNIAVGGGWGGAMGIDTTIWPQKMEIDYVRFYKLNEQSDSIKPSVLKNLMCVKNSNNLALLWEPAYDNYGVKEYQIFSDGKFIGSTRKHGFFIKGLKSAILYNIDVITVDWQGNKSEKLSGKFKTIEESAITIPAKIEAENFFNEEGTEIEATRDTLGGFNISWIEPGDELTYSIISNQDKRLKLNIRAATERKDAIVELYDTNKKLLATCPIGNTSSWQKWQNFESSEFDLPKGSQKIVLKIKGDRININWLEIK